MTFVPTLYVVVTLLGSAVTCGSDCCRYRNKESLNVISSQAPCILHTLGEVFTTSDIRLTLSFIYRFLSSVTLASRNSWISALLLPHH